MAVQNHGAWQGSHRLSASSAKRVEHAVISVELNHMVPSGNLSRIVGGAGGLRSYCCTAMCLVMIARRLLDVHLDVRTLVTPGSYLASSLVLREAGGMLTDLSGNPLAPFDGLTDRRSLIAAANEELLIDVVNRLRADYQHRS